jgi:hypothetical protein
LIALLKLSPQGFIDQIEHGQVRLSFGRRSESEIRRPNPLRNGGEESEIQDAHSGRDAAAIG